MMDHGADPERETSMGLTPLMQAALAGDVDCGQLLIRRGASLDRPSNRNGCTPLIQAVMAARIDAVEYLIHLGATLDFEAEGDGLEVAAVRMTALCAAVMHNQGPSMELLLRKGAEVDRVTADGYTALMHAAASGHVELIYPLVSAGANPNYESVMGHTPLHCAVLADQSPSVCKLVEMGARVTAATLLHRVRPPLHRYFYTASSSTSPEANQLQHSVAGTLGGGLTVDGTMSNAPSQQQLKVHQALYGFMALVDQAIADVPNDLLDQLAAVGAGHFAAAPPASSLHAAVEAGNATLLRSLIGFGADPNAVDRNGNTALHLAVVLGKPGLVPELVAAGTVVERLNKDGKKAADLCDTVAHPELARLLALLGSAGTPSGPLATGPGNGATSAGTGGRPQGSNAPGASNGGGGGKAASDVLSSHGDAPNVPSNVPSKIPPSHGGASNVPSNVASNVASNVSSDLPTSHIEVPNVPPKHSASGMGAAGGSTAAGVLAGQMMAGNFAPSTPDPKAETPNPKLLTLNPKP
jgi:ankyrin repeat protein